MYFRLTSLCLFEGPLAGEADVNMENYRASISNSLLRVSVASLAALAGLISPESGSRKEVVDLPLSLI